jgi:hypothetical protein
VAPFALGVLALLAKTARAFAAFALRAFPLVRAFPREMAHLPTDEAFFFALAPFAIAPFASFPIEAYASFAVEWGPFAAIFATHATCRKDRITKRK